MGTTTTQGKPVAAFRKADGSFKICNDDDCDDCPRVAIECPTTFRDGSLVVSERDTFTVEDDFGGKVVLTRAQLRAAGTVADK